MRRSQIRAAVGGLVVVALFAVGYLVHTSMKAQKRNQMDASTLSGMLPDAVQWIQNFHRIEIKDGKKSWELEADEAQFLQDRNQIVVRKPRTSFYMKEGEKVTVTGETGEVQLDGKDLEKATLHDNVEIHVRGFIVRASDAVYDKSTDKIVAKGAVTIDGEQLKVAGNDMTVFVKESRFTLDQPVRVTLSPKALQPARPS